MKISELSKKTGVSQRMLRHFERLGLLNPSRTTNDYRVYSSKDQERVAAIREWQRLGLTLKEITALFSGDTPNDKILPAAFLRERQVYLKKQRALRGLREHVQQGQPGRFAQRVAYSIPRVESAVANMMPLGWLSQEMSYLKFSEWQSQAEVKFVMAGEMIWQSSFYLLLAADAGDADLLYQFIRDFCRISQRIWPEFDGHPPSEIEPLEIGDFFAPNEVILNLGFTSSGGRSLQIILPYQSLFALAKATG